MKIKICAQPKFYFQLNAEQIAVLMQLSREHYDGVCKSAGQDRGFIFGWNNWYQVQPESEQSASWRELDICLKIMEGAAHRRELWDVALKLGADFRRAMQTANEQLGPIEIVQE